MYRKIRCDVRQWKILGTFRETKHSLGWVHHMLLLVLVVAAVLSLEKESEK